MIYEANEPSSACRLWRISQVETSTPPNSYLIIRQIRPAVKGAEKEALLNHAALAEQGFHGLVHKQFGKGFGDFIQARHGGLE